MRRAVLASIVLISACEHPPTKEIAAAEQQVEKARAAGADRHVPDRWRQAETALAAARQRLQERDYQGALSSANDAAESARLALEGIGAAKEAARQKSTVAIGEVRGALERAASERAAAVKAGVPRRALAPLDATAEEARARLAAVQQQLDLGNFELVAEVTEDLRTQVTPLPDLYRNLRTEAESKRPRPRARGTARRPSR